MPTMPPLPDPQFIVQHWFDVYGWGYVGESIASLDDAAEAIIDGVDRQRTPNRATWRVDQIDRAAGTVIDATGNAWALAMRLIAERTHPSDLPDWHPAYEAPNCLPDFTFADALAWRP